MNNVTLEEVKRAKGLVALNKLELRVRMALDDAEHQRAFPRPDMDARWYSRVDMMIRKSKTVLRAIEQRQQRYIAKENGN